jgi:hypothetical protein
MANDGLMARIWRLRYPVVYLGLALGFVLLVASLREPRTGFTKLILFGERFQKRRLPEVDQTPVFTLRDSWGYDGQFYAQLAVAGDPFHPQLRYALDSPPYRSQRILLPLLAHVLGLGRVRWVLEIYALANLACWIALAALLARWWFPPTDFHNLLRWAGTLFGAGMIISVTRALTDGPALLAIACGARAIERARPRLGALVLAAAGLVRETSVLAGGGFFAPDALRGRRGWARAVALGVACAAPVVLWALVVRRHYGMGGGEGNIVAPFSALPVKLHALQRAWREHGFGSIDDEVFGLTALAVQVGFIVARPRASVLWWRIGAAFALLFVCLGNYVWEGIPSAATRAVLPLTLAFNVLAPRTPGGLVLLAAGNLTLLSVPSLLRQVPSGTVKLTRPIDLDYDAGWYGIERLGRETWRWGGENAVIQVGNASDRQLGLTLTFELRSVVERTVTFEGGGARQSFRVPGESRAWVTFGPFRAEPGVTSVLVTSPEPAWREPGPDGRALVVSVYNQAAKIIAPPSN